nr:hotdog domain-containing protein [Alteripontixanthobacter muriae]
MGYVSHAAYLKWVQDAVVAYWRTVAPKEVVLRYLWVALKHQISYLRPALPDEIIVAEVRANHARGARAQFSTLFMRGEEVLTNVLSSWCCMDSTSRRPTRPPRQVIRLFLT